MSFFKYTESKLAKELITLLNKKDEQEAFVYVPEKHLIQSEKYQFYLINIFNILKEKNKSQRLAYMEKYLQSTLSSQSITFESSAHLLVPRLKTVHEHNNKQRALKEYHATNEILHFPLSNNFIWELGIDSETTIQTVTTDHLKNLTLNKTETFNTALKNLFSNSKKPFKEIEPGIFVSRFKDDHDAARILLIDEIKNLSIKGHPLAFTPTAKDLFICGSKDFAAIEKIALKCREIVSEERSLSLHPLLLKGDSWDDFYPPMSPRYAAVHNLHIAELSIQYDEQKIMLDEQHETEDVDIFVATYQVLSDEDLPFHQSMCVWTETVLSWLPKTDIITFVEINHQNEPQVLGELPWDTAMELFSSSFKPLGLLPERFEVEKFPPKQKLHNAIKHHP